MPLIDNVKTVVLLMFENRSFDHMLGHLSYENLSPVDGLKSPLTQSLYENIFNGGVYNPFILPNDSQLQFDLPHEYNSVKTQLAQSSLPLKKYQMSGFVEAYAASTGIGPNPQCDPMGFFSSQQVPITSFLGRTFCTCDRWFASLPASTQPNRTIAFSGDSSVHETKLQLISIKNSLLDWLENQALIKWKVYHDGLPFFAFYPDLWKYIFDGHFVDYEDLFRDLQNDPSDDDPQVIIVEPSYQDGPHIGPDHPNDNHAPLAIGWGEDFLRRTYQSIIANPKRFESTVMIVYYDEHGGFYDHVPPPMIGYNTLENPDFNFASLGVRIPGIIISPLVEQGSVCSNLFDHTSVLQFLAEKFTPGKPYSDSVKNRKAQGIESISIALTNPNAWKAPQPPNQAINVSSSLGDTIAIAPKEVMGQSFENAAIQMISQFPEQVAQKFPELLQWKNAIDNR